MLENIGPFDEHWRQILDHSRPVLERHAKAMVGEGMLAGEAPIIGCMYFPRIVGVSDTYALSQWLWREHEVLVAPGEFFGLPGHVRIGFGGDAKPLDRNLGRFADALRRYRSS